MRKLSNFIPLKRQNASWYVFALLFAKWIHALFQQMGKRSAAQRLTYVVLWCLIELGLCCLEDVHPGNCSCQHFGTQMIVRCKGIQQVPRDLPSNTAVL